MDLQRNETTPFDGSMPVPAARPLSDFAVERVGDDLVILDGESMQYHTLNLAAAQIWQACDGANSTHRIASELGLPIELVESTMSELGEAGLLQSPSDQWNSVLSRRRVSRLIAAGLLGAVGLPVIKSITVPDAASAASLGYCEQNYPPLEKGGSATCISNQDCNPHCKAPKPNGVCVFPDTSGTGCCTCSSGSSGSSLSDSIQTAAFGEESISEDPYLATDEEGNVDLEAIDALEQEAAPETEAIEPIVEEVAPVEVVESQPAPVEVVESQPETTEIVDASGEGEQETTEEQSS